MPAPSPTKAYTPHGAAEALMYCRDREVMIDGPAGTGKTLGVLHKALLAAVTWPGSRIAMIRKTRKSLTDSVLVSWEEKVVPDGWSLVEEGPHRAYRRSYVHANKSELVLAGIDMADAGARAARAALMSTEFDLICCFEATELLLSDWEALTTRLRHYVMPYQQIVADCNPQGPSHWLKARADLGRMTRLPSRHTENPLLFDQRTGKPTREGEEYLDTLDALSGHRRARLRDGKWVQAEGVVYPTYDAAVHLVDPFEPPSDWDRYRVIDFGFNNPFVCQWYAENPDGDLYRYREIYMTGRTVASHSKTILECETEAERRRIRATIADHDAEDCETLRQNGIRNVVRARKDVRRGIEAVEERLVGSVRRDRPGIYFMRDVLVERDSTLADRFLPSSSDGEWEAYVYPEVVVGKPDKEEPVKQFDHGMDATRYMVAHLDFVGSGGSAVPTVVRRGVAADARARYTEPQPSGEEPTGTGQAASMPRVVKRGGRSRR